MRFYFFTLLSLICFVYPGLAQREPIFPVGEYWQFPDARTLAMAGGGSISNTSPAALMMNPAALTRGIHRFNFMASSTARSLGERRSFPIFNRIDDITQKGVYAINTNAFLRFQGAARFRTQIKNMPAAVAVGVFNELDQDYEYTEQVRENIFGDAPIAVNRIRYDGALTRYAVGAAVQPTEKLRLGMQVGLLSGDLFRERTIDFFNDPSQSEAEMNRRNLDNSPIVASFGAIYDVHSHLSLGGHLRLPYSVDYRVQSTVNGAQTPDARESIEYPLQITGALEYRGRQALRARLNIDVTYEFWSSTNSQIHSENFPNTNFDDVFIIKTAVEHIFFNRIPFQAGVQFRTAYQDQNTSRTLISAGTGFMGDHWRIDVAGGFSNLNYTFPDLFDDTRYGGDRSLSPIDDVEEKFFFGMITLKADIR